MALFWRKWPPGLTFPLALLLIIIGFYWKLTLTRQFDWAWGPDLTQQIVPWYDEEARQMQHHQFPMWDTHNWSGQPLLAQAQPGAAYPLNWLLWLLPRKNGHIQMIWLQWYFVIIHYMAALFCFWLCRDLGRSRPASLLAGLVFGLSGYMGATDWPQMINGAVWAPLVFLFLLRACRGVQPLASAALSGASLGMAWLSGHHQVPIFLMLASAGVWLFYVWQTRDGRFGVARLAAVSLLFAVSVGALQILPAQEYGRLALRWVGAPGPLGWKSVVPYNIHTGYALSPVYLFAILFPGLNAHSNPFIGAVAFSLALMGGILCWKERAVRVFAALALAGIFYALGGNSVFQGLIYALVPWVEKARVPAMATVIFSIGAAVLVAFGVDAMTLGAESVWVGRISTGVTWFGLIAGILFLAVFINKQFSWSTDDRMMITVLTSILMGALLYAWRTRSVSNTHALTLLVLLMLFELGNEAGYRLVDRSNDGTNHFSKTMWGHPELAEFLHSQPGIFRVDSTTDEVLPNWGEHYNLDFMRAYAGVTINSFHYQFDAWETRMLLGTRYTMATAPGHEGQRMVFEGTGGLKVFENPGAFPRAWAVHELFRVTNAEQGKEVIQQDYQSLHRKAFLLESVPGIPPCPDASDRVEIIKYTAPRVAIQADLACDGMVVLSDTFYPGWNAAVDAKPVKTYEVDLAMRGVLVPKGRHEITFVYRPLSVILGAVLTFSGLACAAALAFRARRKRSGDPVES